jgi:hypothetical protein
VQLAFSLVNPVFLEKKEEKKPGPGVAKEKLTQEEAESLRRLPGFIPSEEFSKMGKEEVGRYYCPFANYHMTCANSQCKFSHDSSKPLYGKK